MIMRLQAYDFKLVAKKGTEIPVADPLSRAFVKETGPSLTGEDSHIFTVTTQDIPSILQKEQWRDALDMLHASHQGMVKTKQLGRNLIYWPGMKMLKM